MGDNKKPVLTSDDIREIVQILEGSTFNSLELEIGEVRLKLRRGTGVDAAAERRADAPAFPPQDAKPAAASPPQHAASLPQRAAANGMRRVVPPAPATVEIRAPTIGTFYRAPRPGAAPFVDVGTLVTPQTTVGIIEVMKLMNGVLAGIEGEIREICAEDGAPVEYNQILMRVAQPQA
jgi:acetyl-CoA carboxylase biotin carboxyl carrier protein